MKLADSELRKAAIVCYHVALQSMPILIAARGTPEEKMDSGWQFLCGCVNEEAPKAEVWSLREVLTKDSSLGGLMGLPAGTVLSRSAASQPWTTEPDTQRGPGAP